MASSFRVEGKSSSPTATENILPARHPSLVHHIPDLDAARASSMRRRVERCWGPEDVSDTDAGPDPAYVKAAAVSNPDSTVSRASKYTQKRFKLTKESNGSSYLRYCLEHRQQILALKKATVSRAPKHTQERFELAKESNGSSYLRYCVENKQQILAFKKAAEPEEKKREFLIAAERGHLPVVKKLIAEKIDLEHSGEGGFTALIMASERGHLPVVELLINKGANNIQEALKVST